MSWSVGTSIFKLPILRNRLKGTDVLISYFLSRKTAVLGRLYKHVNPDGIFVIKSDLNPRSLRAFSPNSSLSERHRVGLLERQLLRDVVSSTSDIILAESMHVVELLKHVFPQASSKVRYFPNGYLDACDCPLTAEEVCNAKQKIILVSGRIGAHFKGHHILLRALETIDLRGWTIVFAGPVADSFHQEYRRLIYHRPDLARAVRLVGNITERQQLERLYAKAMVLCHPSIESASSVEGSPLVLAEAHRWGAYILTTDAVPSAHEYIGQDTGGQLVRNNDPEALRKALMLILGSPSEAQQKCVARVNDAQQRLNWKQLVDRLHEDLITLVSARNSTGAWR